LHPKYPRDILPKLVVGIDPGIRPGVACVDIGTRHAWFVTLSVDSCSRSGIIEAVCRRGEPVLFATDRASAPRTLRSLAAAFGCRVWTPRKNISVREKSAITHGLRFRTRHERDALAAAMVAYRRHSKLFEEIDAKLRKMRLNEIGEDVKGLVIKKRISIARAIEESVRQRQVCAG